MQTLPPTVLRMWKRFRCYDCQLVIDQCSELLCCELALVGALAGLGVGGAAAFSVDWCGFQDVDSCGVLVCLGRRGRPLSLCFDALALLLEYCRPEGEEEQKRLS